MREVYENVSFFEAVKLCDSPAYKEAPLIIRRTGRMGPDGGGLYHVFIGCDASSYHSSAELDQAAIHLSKQKAQHTFTPKKPVHNHNHNHQQKEKK